MTTPNVELFSREFVLKAVTNALLNVSKDLYNLGLDDLSALALTMGEQCLNHIDERKDDLVSPRAPNQPFTPVKGVEGCTCKCGDDNVDVQMCNGHNNESVNTSEIEEEVSDIVSKIRAEQSKGSSNGTIIKK